HPPPAPRQSNGNARQCEPCTASDNEPPDIARLRTERHTDADFVDAKADDIAHHAVNSNGRKYEREYGENSEQDGREAARSDRLREQAVERRHMDDGKIRIDFVNFFRCGMSQRNRIRTGADDEVRSPSAGAVNVECGSRVEAKLMNITNDADNRRPARLRIERTQVDALADGIGAGPEAVGGRVIDDDVGSAEVGGRERAAFDERDAHRFEVAEVRAASLCYGACAGFRDGL